MSDTKKVLASIKVLKPTALLQIKGGTSASEDGIVIEDIINL